MSRMSVRLTLVAAGLVATSFVISGCSKKEAAARPEPVVEKPEQPPTPPPAPPEPKVDPNVWKSEVKDVFFDFDKYELRADSRALLQENARALKEHPDAMMVLGGHCDERGTEDYNLALGQRRADAVKSYLTDLGVDGSRLQTISYGEEKPFAMGHDEAAWAQNRRVHFTFK